MKKHILLGISGGIAAYKSCELVRLLKKQGHEVSVAMSRAAAEGHPAFSIACIAPGVVDTEMQREIRNADCRDFPLQPRFRALKDGAKLQTAADTAAKIAAMIEAEDFGCKPLADVRDV